MDQLKNTCHFNGMSLSWRIRVEMTIYSQWYLFPVKKTKKNNKHPLWGSFCISHPTCTMVRLWCDSEYLVFDHLASIYKITKDKTSFAIQCFRIIFCFFLFQTFVWSDVSWDWQPQFVMKILHVSTFSFRNKWQIGYPFL